MTHCNNNSSLWKKTDESDDICTRFIVSLSAGTGSEGSEPWKLHSSGFGFLPIKTFSVC